ncbi:MAG: DUF6913 domain-containing protein [Mangrovibacterium sp.]
MGIKGKLSNYWLKSELKKIKRTNKAFVNINQANTLGLIWQEGDMSAVNALEKALVLRNIKVKKLCYSETEREITFTAKDFSFLGKPKTELLHRFTVQPFDILIDITRSTKYEVKAIRALSKARFKVGSSTEDVSYLDLNIQIDEKDSAEYLVEQILFYLEVIKNAQ